MVPAYRQKARSINQSKAIYFGLALSGDMLVKCLCRNLLIYTLAIEFGNKFLYCKSNHTLIAGFEFWAVGSLLSHDFEPNTTSLKNRLLFNPICELRRRRGSDAGSDSWGCSPKCVMIVAAVENASVQR